ncbi:hypothetical protein Ciccas_007696 [Cichlidogyrus casuarinus]|uniref:Uncharacterized protein n=1 Tax=Cichlidogyrus casuarinus TaxID=1844966 RepID=A0ABD2Q3K5_9PLAT
MNSLFWEKIADEREIWIEKNSQLVSDSIKRSEEIRTELQQEHMTAIERLQAQLEIAKREPNKVVTMISLTDRQTSVQEELMKKLSTSLNRIETELGTKRLTLQRMQNENEQEWKLVRSRVNSLHNLGHTIYELMRRTQSLIDYYSELANNQSTKCQELAAEHKKQIDALMQDYEQAQALLKQQILRQRNKVE